MPPRKLLSQQKGNLTVEQQENKKATEEAMKQLTPLNAEPPAWLDDRAKQEWFRIYPLLEELPIASLDLALVSAYCQAYSDYIQATERMKQEGAVIVTERGTKLNQNHAIKRDALTQLNSISSKLGLTVESRLKILDPKNETPKKQSVYDQFGISDND
ncbi:phage terminase small subunit P27 family [Staphylococcus haemolyticus]|uniref:phage terminase small subunit P27 family n=1 Tax=Staphylococcus haemolyticus TaxID=1283 RepID=UPI001939D993|nr:phage terminase small subunit P27 family [Staphylococcus haemolyticus]